MGKTGLFLEAYNQAKIDPAKLAKAGEWFDKLALFNEAEKNFTTADKKWQASNEEKVRKVDASIMVNMARPRTFAELKISGERLTPSAILYLLDQTLRRMKTEGALATPPKGPTPYENAITEVRNYPLPRETAAVRWH